MSKVLKIVGAIASIAAAAVTLGASIGISAGILSAVAVGASIGASLLAPKPKLAVSTGNSDRLRATIDPRTPRKTASGITALATDIRDEEFTDNQTYFHRFIVVASHKVHAIKEIWFDDKKAWDSTSGVTSDYAGYLTVTPVLEGNASNAIYISSRIGSSRRFTGCAYVYLRYKLTGNDKKSESPFAQSITTRITIRGEGAYFYDPRKDSTVPGGSGSHRADDQTTWEWSADACRNPALAMLHYLLGWKINGKLAVGKGIPVNRIDLPSFIVAANICDETVSTASGGTEPRYRCDGVWSEGDATTTVVDTLKACMNADLDDIDGKLRLTIFHNDLASPVADFTDADILDDFVWDPVADISQSFNIVRGVYTDASDASLYQQPEYPERSFDSPDGIDRIDTFDLPMVESSDQAQRLAELRLRRNKYGGTFKANFQATAWRVQKNSIIRLTFSQRGWVNKLFRVAEMDLRTDGVVPLILREEDADLYDSGGLFSSITALESTPFLYWLDPVYQSLVSVEDQVNAALILAASKGKVWTTATMPAVADSNVGDTWIDPADGTFYERVSATGLLLGGKVVVLDGHRPFIAWKLAETQVLRDAKATADAAYVDANAAIDAVAGLADDGVLSINEKITKLIPESARLADKWASLSATAASLSVSSSAAASARASWLGMLAALAPAWNDITQDSPVVRATYDGARDAYDAALYALAQAIDAKAATLASWSGVSGTGKPADNATVGAPSGTNVGSTSATTVESGANAANAGVNSDGTIKTDKVTTASLQDNSVSALGFLYSPGSGGGVTSGDYPTWTDVHSLTVTATDKPVQTAFAVNVIYAGDAGYTPSVEIRLLRNGSDIFDGPTLYPSDYTNDYRYFEVVDTPGAGAVTYKIQARAYHTHPDVGAVFANRLLKAVELKK